MFSITKKLNRGVSKIVEDSQSSSELDINQVREIVTEVFQRKGLAPPYTIEFEPKPSMDSKPQVYFEDDSLHIVAYSEPELRRLIGRFVIERSWSPHEWLVTNHVGVYSLISATILTTLPAIGFQLSWMIPDLRLLIVLSTIITLSVFAFWTGYQVSIRSAKLLRKLTIEMVDLGCMTRLPQGCCWRNSHLYLGRTSHRILWHGLLHSG